MQSLYETSLLSGAKSGGLQLAHKLTREHIFLTPRSRMRVDLAAQVYIYTYTVPLYMSACS